MTEHAIETEQERSAASSESARGGQTMSSVHQSIDVPFDPRAEGPARSRPSARRIAMLLAAALATIAVLILMAEQPELSLILAATGGGALLTVVMRRTRLDRADSIVLVGRSSIASIVANTLETGLTGKRRLTVLRASGSSDVPTLVRGARCDEVVIAGPAGPVLMNLVDARGKRPAILSGSEKLEVLLGRVPMELAQQDKWLTRLGNVRALDPIHARAKRMLDLLFALSLGILILPLFPLIALAIKLDSPGSVLYSQTRVGLGGKTFRIYKFRTMRQDAEKDGAKWAQARDPRITRIGNLMRLTRFDELPQLWNVLRGEMAVVGPRPERPEFTETLAAEIPGYDLRHTVKPGLTGWAQVCYRYTSSIRDTQAKVEYDLYYVKHLSFAFDLKILYRTVGVVLGRKGR
jgi:exopolysaccharide biosynthesis polyprenyl glycosylphosphotransferase